MKYVIETPFLESEDEVSGDWKQVADYLPFDLRNALLMGTPTDQDQG